MLNSTKLYVDFNHFSVWFSKQIETDVTLRLYVCELSILSFSAVYCMRVLVCFVFAVVFVLLFSSAIEEFVCREGGVC